MQNYSLCVRLTQFFLQGTCYVDHAGQHLLLQANKLVSQVTILTVTAWLFQFAWKKAANRVFFSEAIISKIGRKLHTTLKKILLERCD
jgi:hypothetical protein